MYVNGVLVGSAADYKVTQQYTVNLQPASELVFAVLATNNGPAANPAGVLAAIEINMAVVGRANCTSGIFILSDAGWKSTKGAIPDGFELPGFDDSAWPEVKAQAAYPGAPWGTVILAAASPPVTV